MQCPRPQPFCIEFTSGQPLTIHVQSASLSNYTKGKGINLTISALEGKYGEAEVQLRAFLNSALDGVQGLSTPGPFTAQERTIGGFQGRYGRFTEERSLVSLPVFEVRIVQLSVSQTFKLADPFSPSKSNHTSSHACSRTQRQSG